jgi:hypothetical protein
MWRVQHKNGSGRLQKSVPADATLVFDGDVKIYDHTDIVSKPGKSVKGKSTHAFQVSFDGIVQNLIVLRTVYYPANVVCTRPPDLALLLRPAYKVVSGVVPAEGLHAHKHTSQDDDDDDEDDEDDEDDGGASDGSDPHDAEDDDEDEVLSTGLHDDDDEDDVDDDDDDELGDGKIDDDDDDLLDDDDSLAGEEDAFDGDLYDDDMDK